MLSQKYVNAYKGLLTSFLMLISSSLLADLTVSISQVDPVPPLANCQDQNGVPVKVGGKVSYEITITNTGPGSVRGISLDDTLISDINPSGVSIADVTACRDDFRIIPGCNSFHLDSHATLAAGESLTFTARYKIYTGLNQQGYSTLTNIANVTSLNSIGCQLNSTVASLTSCVQGCTLAVSVIPAIPTSVCSNQSITLTARVCHSLCSEAQLNFVWRDPNGNIIQDGTNPQLILFPGFLPGIYAVTVTDTCTGGQANAFSGTITGVECADLAIIKTASVNDDQIIYTITVTNNGPSASLVTVTDCLPTCLAPVQSIPLSGSNWSFIVNGNCLTAQLVNGDLQPINLQPNSSASFQIVTQKNNCCGKFICNTATVQGSLFDPDLCNNSSTVKVRN